MQRLTSSAFALLYLAVFINILAFSMVFPLLPVYARHFDASDLTVGFLAASFALAQFLFSPLWGLLSDRFGRKPIILVGLLGISASLVTFGFASSLATLGISRFLQGVFSGAVLPGARAYVADSTTKEERVKRMGHIGAFLALGIIFGPALGGYLGQFSLGLPFLVAAAIAFGNFLFVFSLLPESLKEKTPLPSRMRSIFLRNFTAVSAGLKSNLMPLFLLGFAWSFSFSNNQVAVPLLGLEQFELSIRDIGFLFTVIGTISAIVQFFLLERITKFLGQHLTVALGMVLLALGFGIMPFLGAVSLLYGAVAVAGLGSAVARPVTTALISEETKVGQGITMGTANAFESLGRLVGPLFGGFLFGLAPFLPFLFSAVVVLSLLLFILLKTPFLSKRHAF